MERFLETLPPYVRDISRKSYVRTMLTSVLPITLIVFLGFGTVFCVYRYLAVPFYEDVFVPAVTFLLVFNHNLFTVVQFILLSMAVADGAKFMNSKHRKNLFCHKEVLIPAAVSCLLFFHVYLLTAVRFILFCVLLRKAFNIWNDTQRNNALFEVAFVPCALYLLVFRADLSDAVLILLCIASKRASDFSNPPYNGGQRHPRPYEFGTYISDPSGRTAYNAEGYIRPRSNAPYTPRLKE